MHCKRVSAGSLDSLQRPDMVSQQVVLLVDEKSPNLIADIPSYLLLEAILVYSAAPLLLHNP